MGDLLVSKLSIYNKLNSFLALLVPLGWRYSVKILVRLEAIGAFAGRRLMLWHPQKNGESTLFRCAVELFLRAGRRVGRADAIALGYGPERLNARFAAA
jgi:hypothetical protein